MQSLVIKTHKLLLKNTLTVAVAESCTAGLLSYLLTRQAGSSRSFLLGITAYSNAAKVKLLSIPPSLLSKHGAVSSVVASAMAESVRRIGRADYGVGITGIAGPAGGTKAKPIGTVFIAVATKEKTLCKRFLFRGSRFSVRKQAAFKALELLYADIYRNPTS